MNATIIHVVIGPVSGQTHPHYVRSDCAGAVKPLFSGSIRRGRPPEHAFRATFYDKNVTEILQSWLVERVILALGALVFAGGVVFVGGAFFPKESSGRTMRGWFWQRTRSTAGPDVNAAL
jgi:hypothetical protein